MIDSITKWLRRNLNQDQFTTLHIWIIGSILEKNRNPRDCDILLIIDREDIDYLVRLSPKLRNDFEENFGIPLHLTRITVDEIRDCIDFLKAVLKQPFLSILKASVSAPDIQRELRQIEAEFANAEGDGLNPAPPTPHPLQTWLVEWYATPDERDPAWWEDFEADLSAHRLNFAERLDANEE